MKNKYLNALTLPLVLEVSLLLLDHYLIKSEKSLIIVAIAIPLVSYQVRKASFGKIVSVFSGVFSLVLFLAFTAIMFVTKSTPATNQILWAMYKLSFALVILYGVPVCLILSVLGTILATFISPDKTITNGP